MQKVPVGVRAAFLSSTLSSPESVQLPFGDLGPHSWCIQGWDGPVLQARPQNATAWQPGVSSAASGSALSAVLPTLPPQAQGPRAQPAATASAVLAPGGAPELPPRTETLTGTTRRGEIKAEPLRVGFSPGVVGDCWEQGNGVSAQSFLHCFTLASAAFNLQVATPGGKTMDFVDVNESNTRWVQDFRLKAYASPAKLESIDGARYHALLIPSCPGALVDLASSGSLARILQHFHSESKPICAVGHGVAALCCATSEDRSWVFQGYSVTGPSVYELVRVPGFAHLPLIVEDFVKDAGACFSASEPDAMHVVLDRHLVTGQNASSTVPAVQNLLFLCGSRK
ncbi:PREDICTED: Parkinson disease 7 domain-containing protein 1 [Bison bison bison]|uniref:Glutamine amidotransferase-like class 1 domain-containing protein 1 n=1 Tax=Bison bison bison TaxID=43346 RepID=A0A6P3HXW2_BISBB|nr:PREDICTED: Parkinson disease 7 domain-containing protein 1 [Bison bison bison]